MCAPSALIHTRGLCDDTTTINVQQVNMPIIYSVIARGTTVLTEYATTTGNFATVSKSILEKIPAANGKMSYAFDKYAGVSSFPFRAGFD